MAPELFFGLLAELATPYRGLRSDLYRVVELGP
jgi:hypothetical protein